MGCTGFSKVSPSASGLYQVIPGWHAGDDDDVDDDDDDDAVMGVGWLGSCWYDHWLVS